MINTNELNKLKSQVKAYNELYALKGGFDGPAILDVLRKRVTVMEEIIAISKKINDGIAKSPTLRNDIDTIITMLMMYDTSKEITIFYMHSLINLLIGGKSSSENMTNPFKTQWENVFSK